jgi:lipopolysaccharide biosynthesis glycosyltransferase
LKGEKKKREKKTEEVFLAFAGYQKPWVLLGEFASLG